MSTHQELTFWVEVEPVWSRHYVNGHPRLDGVRLGRATKGRPASLRGPAVKMTLRIPSRVFDSVLPPVVVEIPESAVAMPVVTVEVDEDATTEAEPTSGGAR